MNNIDLYIGDDKLDFNRPVNVVFQSYDLRDTNIGSNNKSYTLEIPLTKANIEILQFANKVGSVLDTFEQARLVENGVLIIKGKLNILSISTNSISAIINADDWVGDIKGKTLRELSWVSGDDHLFLDTIIQASWAAAAGAFYRYPMVNYAQLCSEERGADSTFTPNDFLAMWNINQIVEKIFADAGYTLDSANFFGTTEGKKLYILSDEPMAESSFKDNKDLTLFISSDNLNKATITHLGETADEVTLTKAAIDFDVEYIDEGSDYNTVSNKYIVPITGTYRFKSAMSVYCWHNIAGPATFAIYGQTIDLGIIKDNTDWLCRIQDTSSSLFGTGNNFELDTGWVYLEAGQEITVKGTFFSEAYNETIDPEEVDLLVRAYGTYWTQVMDGRNLLTGLDGTVSPTTHLPNIDSVDFLAGLKHLYNLRFWRDQLNNTIYITAGDTFIGDNVIDWSAMVDFSENPKQEFLSVNYNKDQIIAYKEDTTDEAYNQYDFKNGRPYTKELTLSSQFAKAGSHVNENPLFAPSVPVRYYQIGNTGENITAIFGSSEIKSTTEPYPIARNLAGIVPRILVWEGAAVSLITGSWYYAISLQKLLDGTTINKGTTAPVVVCPYYENLFSTYMDKDWHYIDGGKLIKIRLHISYLEIMPFVTVISAGNAEGFRAVYKINVDGDDMYFILTKITFSGSFAIGEFIQKL